MAVKVVSEGPVVTEKITCTKCGYRLEYTGEDITTTTDCDGDAYHTIKCPRVSCGEKLYVKPFKAR
jgi:hypothetical protein